MTDARPNIWRLQAQSDVDGLIKALENTDPDIRLRAAIALRALSATSAISPIRARLAIEDNAEVRTNLTQVLVFLLEEHEERSEQQKSAPPDETALLVSQLKSKDSEDVIHAAQALGALGDPIAVEALIMLFNNGAKPANVRLAAAEALIELKSPPTSVTALVALRRPDWHIRRIAAAMLGHLEADWAIEPLRKTLTDENELVRRTARAALKHIGTPEALNAAESVPEDQPSPEPQSPTLIAVAPPEQAASAPKVEAQPLAETPMPQPSAPSETVPTSLKVEEPPSLVTPTATQEATTLPSAQSPVEVPLTEPSSEAVPAVARAEESPTATTSAPASMPEIATSPTAEPPADNEPKSTESQPSADTPPKVETSKEAAPSVLPAQPSTSIPPATPSIAAESDALMSSDGASSAVESAKQNTSQQ